MISNENLGAIMGAPVQGPDGNRIGTVGQVFVDPVSGSPNWVTVHTGLFGRHETFVPLDDADWDREVLRIPYEKGLVKDAPRIDTDEALTPQTESELYRYYGLAAADSDETSEMRGHRTDTDGDRNDETDNDRSDRAVDQADADDGDGAPDTGEAVDDGTRLRKYVITEQQEVTVPVTREEVRLEPDPGTESGAEPATESSAGEEPKRQRGRHRA